MNNKAIILIVSKPHSTTDTADHAKAQIDIIKKHSRQLNCDIIESIAVKVDIDRVNEHILRIAANTDNDRTRAIFSCYTRFVLWEETHFILLTVLSCLTKAVYRFIRYEKEG